MENKVKVTDELMESIIENFRSGLPGFMTICIYPVLSSIRTEHDRRKLASSIAIDLASCLEDYTQIDVVLPNVMNRFNTEPNMQGTKSERR